jgi:hypothetical protein
MQSQITAALFDEKLNPLKQGGCKGEEGAKREIDFKLEIGKTRNWKNEESAKARSRSSDAIRD